MARKWLIGLIIVIGLIHLATLSVDSTPLHWVFKLTPMLLIIALAVTSPPSGKSARAYKTLIVIGLVFGIAGDAFLLVPGDTSFMFGLASFLIGHLFYIVALLPRVRYSLLGLLASLPIAAYLVFMIMKLHDGIMADGSQSGLWIPVLVYVLVIGTMFEVAILSRNMHAAIGSLFFVVSDSILAWNKFIGEVTMSGILIMATYFAAQLLLAGSIANVFRSK
jgi:alkenylglycerophosphocholine/alkenylglycerophosphoethanolamine hydrolase